MPELYYSVRLKLQHHCREISKGFNEKRFLVSSISTLISSPALIHTSVLLKAKEKQLRIKILERTGI